MSIGLFAFAGLHALFHTNFDNKIELLLYVDEKEKQT